MTDVYGVNATKRLQDVPRAMIPPGEQAGILRVAYDKYTLDSDTLETADTLFMMKIPKGARVIDLVMKQADCGGSGAVNIGWQVGDTAAEAADADGFFAAADVSGQADVLSSRNDAASPAGIGKKFAEEVQVVIVATTNCTSTSGDIELFLYYLLD